MSTLTHIDATGVNLAVYSAHAQAIEWCVFDPSGTHEILKPALSLEALSA